MFEFKNLDKKTRSYMANELHFDIERKSVYYSKYMKAGYDATWNKLLLEAIENHDPIWLENAIIDSDMLNKMHPRKDTMVNVPVTAAQTLAEGEFNRFYCRGLCEREVEEKQELVQVYRGKRVERARSSSEAMIGKQVSPKTLLNDLRANIGLDTALGLPNGPNSGLTIQLI